jgi:hypothetical protein
MNYKHFIRHKSTLDNEELKGISEGVSVCRYLEGGRPFVEIVVKFGDEHAITVYFLIMPRAVYLYLYFDTSFNYLLSQIEHNGHYYFLDELKEKLPTFFKVLYNTMLYHNNKGNSDKGVFYQDVDVIHFVKRFNAPKDIPIADDLDIDDFLRMAEPYIDVGLKLMCEMVETPELEGYKDKRRLENRTENLKMAVEVLRLAIFMS